MCLKVFNMCGECKPAHVVGQRSKSIDMQSSIVIFLNKHVKAQPTLGAQFKNISSFCIYANNLYTSNGLFTSATIFCKNVCSARSAEQGNISQTLQANVYSYIACCVLCHVCVRATIQTLFPSSIMCCVALKT